MNSSLELHKKEERLMKKFIALLLTLLLALSAAAPALAEKQTYRSLYSGEVTTLNYLTTTTTSEFGRFLT